jgi:hypothetical protein
VLREAVEAHASPPRASKSAAATAPLERRFGGFTFDPYAPLATPTRSSIWRR